MDQSDTTTPHETPLQALVSSVSKANLAAHPSLHASAHQPLAPASSTSATSSKGALSLLVDADSCKDELEAGIVLLGRGTVEMLQSLGIRCTANDIAQTALGLTKLELSVAHSTFTMAAPFDLLAPYVANASHRWPKLVLKALDLLCKQGNMVRAGWIINETLGIIDASDLVARYPFAFINSGWLELVETIVLDETFGARPPVRGLINALRETLWAHPKRFMKQAHSLTLMAQMGLKRMPLDAHANEEEAAERRLWMQAKAAGSFFCSWDDPAHEPSQWLGQVSADALTHSFDVLRRGRWLLVRGRLSEALTLVEAHQGFVPQKSLVGSLLTAEELLSSLLMGRPYTETVRQLLDGALSWCKRAGLLVLEQSIQGFSHAALGFLGQAGTTGDLQCLVERALGYPDPLLEKCLHVGLGAMHYRARSFYAALSHVRGLARECVKLGATDLAHCAYVLEVLCQGAVGEEPAYPPKYRAQHPAALGLYPLVRLAHGVATNICEILEEMDPEGLRDTFTMNEPTFVAKVLASTTLAGTWPEAVAIRRVLPDSWILDERPASVLTTKETISSADEVYSFAPQASERLGQLDVQPDPSMADRPSVGQGSKDSLGASRQGEGISAMARNGAQPPASSTALPVITEVQGSQEKDDSTLMAGALASADYQEKPVKALPAAPAFTEQVASLLQGPKAKKAESQMMLAPNTPEVVNVGIQESGIPKLEICLLGDFDVRLGDQKVEEARWQRKAGKILLAALAIAPNHTRTRAELCDLLWPDRDYLLSRNSLYAVLSSVRDTLGCKHGEPRYIQGGQGKLSLNPYLVECDLDVFVDRCHEVLSRQGDAPYRLSLCRHLGRLYAGGLTMPAGDVRGDFLACRETLEQLYVDMLVEAANLSLKAGLAKEALWFSKDAKAKGPLREDVVTCHLRALAADGRSAELEKAFQSYCNELNEGLLMAPSARMRSLYSELKRLATKTGNPAA